MPGFNGLLWSFDVVALDPCNANIGRDDFVLQGMISGGRDWSQPCRFKRRP
jgi:hypothetical protein